MKSPDLIVVARPGLALAVIDYLIRRGQVTVRYRGLYKEIPNKFIGMNDEVIACDLKEPK